MNAGIGGQSLCIFQRGVKRGCARAVGYYKEACARVGRAEMGESFLMNGQE